MTLPQFKCKILIMHAYVPQCFAVLRISVQEIGPCHLRITLLDPFHNCWWLACSYKMPDVIIFPMLCIFCWLLFSMAAWYFAISFCLLKCSHFNYVLGCFLGFFVCLIYLVFVSFVFLCLGFFVWFFFGGVVGFCLEFFCLFGFGLFWFFPW